MNGFMGNGATEIWGVSLFIVLAIAALAAIAGGYFVWKKRSVAEDDPLPHCDLEKRLGEIAHATLMQAKKTA